MSKNISDTIEIMASFSNNYDRNKHKRALKKTSSLANYWVKY